MPKNKDDHARNFAFLYEEKTGKFRLAPAYDLTYTPKILEHATSANWNGNPTKQDMFVVGEKIGIPKATQIAIQNQIEQIVLTKLSKYWK